jgi:hypothetical protein
MCPPIVTGGADVTNPTGSKGGSTGVSQEDYFMTWGTDTFYILVNSGATSTKCWVTIEGYKDDPMAMNKILNENIYGEQYARYIS